MNKEQLQKELLTKILKTAQEIDRTSKSNYIHVSEEFIQTKANDNGITFDEMVEIIENELKPKQ
jgi:hypothetical protein